MASPADGRTQVSTKEGGLFELSPNDDIAAGPGILDSIASGGGVLGRSCCWANALEAAVTKPVTAIKVNTVFLTFILITISPLHGCLVVYSGFKYTLGTESL